ncbi:hypothetical protein AA101099_1876 [Neoasaia chiangmaiensis NBRC 101099]|uniref:Uncharacterized protein n=1 Tax=Neoasaia chiangmaiensis TaxID=320497 RepID=A0A1U9KR29_9PROT|nr:hypothetical protein [Neoasaia chiangmaiensis]AQS88182.1 hypothetical protein A0U93_09780 [Neoasaia chiangmaiensis]GBR39918.1 hypothetical protein AA101099_1876 [Neoasaia chiangmaiensis NBRC 101099]GEN14800.1 hypothetical protein NCH01_12310 [Neoasaia chiangmaiensis]
MSGVLEFYKSLAMARFYAAQHRQQKAPSVTRRVVEQTKATVKASVHKAADAMDAMGGNDRLKMG